MKLNRQHFAEMLRADYLTVGVVFQYENNTVRRTGSGYSVVSPPDPPKVYTYKLPKDSGVKEGDTVIVKTPENTLKLCTVVRVDGCPGIDGTATFQYKWAVGTITDLLTKYEENIEKDRKIGEAVTRLENRLEQQMLKKEVVQMLAELPEAEAEEFRAIFNLPKQLTQSS